MGKKIIFFELNEVPFKVIDYFCRKNPHSCLAKRLPVCWQYETYAADVSSLSPWKTWPTVHRGVNDEKHLIYDFGQDLSEVDKEYPPSWKILAQNGIRTGVCGTLHSYPLPEDLNNYAFYLPDTFATGSECFPKVLSKFQSFNLKMARESARNVTSRVPWNSALHLLAHAPEIGLKLQTLADVGRQLIVERAHPWQKVRRRTYQAVLAFDVFMKQLELTRPMFATFFTNHVASSMHRYWAATFPEDYQTFEHEADWVGTFRDEIEFSMSKFDSFFVRLAKFINRHPEYSLWIVTSMGQAATQALVVETQLYVTDLTRFLTVLGLRVDDWRCLPAMLPQINLIISPSKVAHFRNQLERLRIDGELIGFREAADGFFSLDFGHPNLYLKEACVQIGEKEFAFEELGLRNVEIEDKSGACAYHIPQGSLIIYDPEDLNPSGELVRPQISTLDILPSVLHNFSIPIPTYMNHPVNLFRQ